MATPVKTTLDFTGGGRALGLPTPVQGDEAANKDYVDSAVEGLAWKDSVRVSTQGNISLASPGATIDGITMSLNDRVLVRAQSAQTENGIYIWNGAAVALSRSLDANSFPELEQAVVTVEEGTSAASTFRQTAVNGTIGSTNIVWTSFGTAAPSATETTAGIAEIATQAETDTGTDDVRFVTPLKAKNASWGAKRFSSTIGDGSATSYTVTHNIGSEDVTVQVKETSGLKRIVLTDVEVTGINSVTVKFNTAPALNSHRVTVIV